MPVKIGFVGFRHGHALAMFRHLQAHPETQVVAAVEEDPTARAAVQAQGIEITHPNVQALLEQFEIEVLACGEVYARRGAVLIAALERGLSVLADKPICTTLDELERIAALARDKQLRVGAMLDLPDSAPFRTASRLIGEGAIGAVHSVSFAGQHPLLYGTRPDWYFAPGEHGGTLNDIAIHAVDALPWMTGREIVEVTAARAWNARHQAVPHFQDAATCMLRLDNQGCALGDLSYLAPDSHGYAMPYYWRFNLSGEAGHLEVAMNGDHVLLFRDTGKTPERVPLDAARPGGYLDDFLLDLAGQPNPRGLHTRRVLQSSRVALTLQAAADQSRFPWAITPA